MLSFIATNPKLVKFLHNNVSTYVYVASNTIVISFAGTCLTDYGVTNAVLL